MTKIVDPEKFRESMRAMVDQQKAIVKQIPRNDNPAMEEASNNVHQSLDILDVKLEDPDTPIEEIDAISRLVVYDIEIAATTCKLVMDRMETSVAPATTYPKMTVEEIIEVNRKNEISIEEGIAEGYFYRHEFNSLAEWKEQLDVFETTVNDGCDDVFVKLEERKLDDLTIKLSEEIFDAKRMRTLN